MCAFKQSKDSGLGFEVVFSLIITIRTWLKSSHDDLFLITVNLSKSVFLCVHSQQHGESSHFYVTHKPSRSPDVKLLKIFIQQQHLAPWWAPQVVKLTALKLPVGLSCS